MNQPTNNPIVKQFTLCIKGDLDSCQAALDSHGVEATFVKALSARTLQYLANGKTTIFKLASWFNEGPDQAPFPPGTLLWYTDLQIGPKRAEGAQEEA